MKTNLFTLIRKVHFFSAAAVAVLLVFYAMTAWFMEYDDFFPHEEHSETERVTLREPAPDALHEGETSFDEAEAEAWALGIARELALPGRLNKVARDESGRWRADFDSPSSGIRVLVASGARQADLQHVHYGPVTAATRLHQLRGTEGSVANQLWALVVDAVALIMILFSVSGVYLWYATERDVLGLMLLFAGVVFVAGSVVFFS